MGVFDQVVKLVGRVGSNIADIDSRGSKNALAVEVLDANGNQISISSGLVTAAYDYIELSNYNANNDPGTIVYKINGASGTIVATLTLAYSGSNLISVTKT